MLPHCGTPQGNIAQVTPWWDGSLFTVATMFGTVPPAGTLVVFAGAVTDTEIARTVIVTDADTIGLATETAVIVTGKSPDGGVAGAM